VLLRQLLLIASTGVLARGLSLIRILDWSLVGAREVLNPGLLSTRPRRSSSTGGATDDLQFQDGNRPRPTAESNPADSRPHANTPALNSRCFNAKKALSYR